MSYISRPESKIVLLADIHEELVPHYSDMLSHDGIEIVRADSAAAVRLEVYHHPGRFDAVIVPPNFTRHHQHGVDLLRSLVRIDQNLRSHTALLTEYNFSQAYLEELANEQIAGKISEIRRVTFIDDTLNFLASLSRS